MKTATTATILAVALLTAVELSAYAAEFEKIPAPECLGNYACMHDEMHRLGLVDELRRLEKRSCCNDEGECRPVWVNPVYEDTDNGPAITGYTAIIDGNKCPISKEVFNNAKVLGNMPVWMNTLACVPKKREIGGGCPARIYCIGTGGQT